LDGPTVYHNAVVHAVETLTEQFRKLLDLGLSDWRSGIKPLVSITSRVTFPAEGHLISL
jgi:hypothetical protein